MRIPGLRTLDRYILRRFLSIYAANLVSFTLIFVLIDAVSHYEDFARKTDGLGDFLGVCFSYYAAMTPLIFCQVLGPVVSLSAALFAVTTLQRANELTPILAAGTSHQRIFLPVLAASLGISAAVFLIQEKWIPGTVTSIRQAVEARGGRDMEKHVKHLDTVHSNLIVLREYERFTRRARGVDVIPVGRDGGNEVFLRAATAEWIEPRVSGPGALKGYWLLRDGVAQEYQGGRKLVIRRKPADWTGGPPALLCETFAERHLETNLIPEDIELRRDEAVYMTLGDLRRKAETSPDHSGWTVKYYSRFAYPAVNFILVLLGLPVIVFFGNRNIFFGALIAVGISTSYFVLNSVLQDLGVQGEIPVRWGTVLAPILFTSLGATAYRGMKS